MDRARQGFESLFGFMNDLRRGQPNPVDGVFISMLRILLKNPEVLLWNYQYFEGSEEVHRLVYETVNAIRPEIQVGRHVDHLQSSTSITYRASLIVASREYEEIGIPSLQAVGRAVKDAVAAGQTEGE